MTVICLRHLFDGSALVRRFNIRDGEVTYQCQFVKTESFKVCMLQFLPETISEKERIQEKNSYKNYPFL